MICDIAGNFWAFVDGVRVRVTDRDAIAAWKAESERSGTMLYYSDPEWVRDIRAAAHDADEWGDG